MFRRVEPEPNRTPRLRACLACRSSKHKCDGRDKGETCSRCARNLRECIWPEKRQMGRPKRHSQTGREDGSGRDSEPIPLFPVSASASRWVSDQAAEPLQSQWNESSTSRTRQSPDEFSSQNDDSSSPSTWHPQPLQNAQRAESCQSSEYSSSSPEYQHAQNPTPTTSYSTSPEFRPSTHSFTNNSELLGLIDIYYSIPHNYLPVLPPKTEFLANLADHPPLLLTSVLALATPYATSPVSNDYHTLAISMLSSTPLPPTNITTKDTVQYVQALLILTYLEFGQAKIPQACELCRQACSLVVALRWNLLDVDDINGHKVSPSELLSLSLRTTGNLGAAGPTVRDEDPLKRIIRVTWWECWVTDTMLSVTCRIKRNFHGAQLKVQIPSAPEFYSDPGCPIIWYYPLRIRTLTLLIEAVSFPECPDALRRAQHAEQFNMYDTIIENVMMECQIAWADCVKAYATFHNHGPTIIGYESAIGKETLFMTILMLHAASVHLHHLYAMPEVNFDVKVCGITTGTNMLDLELAGASNNYTSGVFLPSLSKIVTASRALMALMRTSHQTNVQLNNTSARITQPIAADSSSTTSSFTNTAPSSPRSASSSENSAVGMVTEDILRHSPFCGCSQVVAAFGAALEVATASNKWQAMAAESNFSTSRMVLQRLKRLWPVAGVFEEELNKCHGAIQGALEVW